MEGLFRGTWFRSEIELKGNTIVPVPPFEAYNPFDWYYSAGEVRQGERSLHLEFLSVDANKPEEVVRFCERFGVLGNPLRARFQAMTKARSREREFLNKEFSDDVLPRDSKNRLVREAQWSSNSTLLLPKDLCLPLSFSSFGFLQSKLKMEIILPTPLDKKFKPSSFGTDENLFQILYTEEECFASPINSEVFKSDVKPQIKWNVQDQRHEMVWHSFALEGYLWLMLMLDQLGPGKILSCPRCQKFFMTPSNRTKYCSPSCYENYKVQKYQSKKKAEKLAAQTGERHKTTKSATKKK